MQTPRSLEAVRGSLFPSQVTETQREELPDATAVSLPTGRPQTSIPGPPGLPAASSGLRMPDPRRVERRPARWGRTRDVRAGEHVGPAVGARCRQRQTDVDGELRPAAQALAGHRLPPLRRRRRQMRPQQPAGAHCCTARRTASSASPASKSPRATPLASCAQRCDSIVIQPAAYHARELPPGRSAARATTVRRPRAGVSDSPGRRICRRSTPRPASARGQRPACAATQATRLQPIRRHGKGPRTGAPGATPSTTRGIGAAATMGERGGSGAGGRTGACARGRAAPGDQRRRPARSRRATAAAATRRPTTPSTQRAGRRRKEQRPPVEGPRRP